MWGYFLCKAIFFYGYSMYLKRLGSITSSVWWTTNQVVTVHVVLGKELDHSKILYSDVQRKHLRDLKTMKSVRQGYSRHDVGLLSGSQSNRMPSVKSPAGIFSSADTYILGQIFYWSKFRKKMHFIRSRWPRAAFTRDSHLNNMLILQCRGAFFARKNPSRYTSKRRK